MITDDSVQLLRAPQLKLYGSRILNEDEHVVSSTSLKYVSHFVITIEFFLLRAGFCLEAHCYGDVLWS